MSDIGIISKTISLLVKLGIVTVIVEGDVNYDGLVNFAGKYS